MKSIKELLKAKREGGAWSSEHVAAFVQGVVTGEVSSAQAGAFLMAACIHDLTASETAALTAAMTDSGARFPRGITGTPAIDKHSTGGVGDKISLLLAPLVAECGVTVPMISGRGLGHTGGTVDKLESVVDFRTDLSMPELQHLLQREHLIMAAQSPELAPADRILYALRDVTGTVENVGLITASILSKKFAEGLDGLVMDIKVGKGAFMRTLEDAQRLATSIKNTCAASSLPCTIVFSRMDRPLGSAVGNWVEMVEAEAALMEMDGAHPYVRSLTCTLAEQMVLLAGVCRTPAEAADRVRRAWSSHAAWRRFHRMIEQQGGSWETSVEKYRSAATMVVEAADDGYVAGIDPMTTALAVMHAGGGRLVESDVIDPAAGVVFVADVGDAVQRGQPLAMISASDPAKLEPLRAALLEAIDTTTAPVEPEPSIIIDIWSS